MSSREQVQAGLAAAVAGPGRGLPVADELCRACVELLGLDAAAVSVTVDGRMRGTFGSSGQLARRLDELQFTFGEGPCLDAAARGMPVLVADLAGLSRTAWPAYAGAVQEHGMQAVFALPVTVAASLVGALDLYRRRPGPLSDDDLAGALRAAEFAALPLLDLLTGIAERRAASTGVDADTESEFGALQQVEINQAIGMIMGQLDVGPVTALARLRGHAFATGKTARAVAWAIVERRLVLDDDLQCGGNGEGGWA